MTSVHKLFEASKDENGAGTVTGLFILIIAMMIGGLAVDYTNGTKTRAQLQTAADSAALAGAMALPEGELEVRRSAMDLAGLYGPSLLKDSDVVLGNWSGRNFTESDFPPPNAVSVTTRRSDANSNALQTFLLHIVGIDRLNIATQAIAVRERRQPACSGGGYFAKGMISANSSNEYTDGFCLYGHAAIHLHNRNTFELGTVVSTPDLSNVFEHRNNIGLGEALRPASLQFSRTQDLPQFFDSVRSHGVTSDVLPPYITKGPIYRQQMNQNFNPEPNTLYIVNGDVTLRGDRSFEKVAILARGSITIQSNVELRDVVLAADESITLNSNIRIGGSEADYCLQDSYSSYLLTRRDITMGSNIALRGIMMASMGDITMNSNNEATQGVYAEALGDISYNSAAKKQGCENGYESTLLYADWVLGIVK